MIAEKFTTTLLFINYLVFAITHYHCARYKLFPKNELHFSWEKLLVIITKISEKFLI